MKLDAIDLSAIEFLRKSFKKAAFKDLTGNDALGLARGFLVLDEFINEQKAVPAAPIPEPEPEPMTLPKPIAIPVKDDPLPIAALAKSEDPFKIFDKELEEPKKKGRPKKNV